MGLFSSDEPQQQTTTAVLSPEQQRLIQLGMPGVEAYAAKPAQRFQGSTVAGWDPSQVAGQEGALASAGTQTSLARAGGGTSNYWLDPSSLDIRNNPGLQGNIDAATRPIWQGLTESALPAVRDSAERSGNFGSSRQGIAEGLATGRAAQAVGDATSGLVGKAYETNVNAQLKALGLLPQTVEAQTAGDKTTAGVGDARQQMAQQLIDQDVANFNFDQNAEYLKSKDILGLASGIPGGSTVSTGTQPKKNPLSGALGGAATGASIGSVIPGVGTAVGAGVGGLIGFLS